MMDHIINILEEESTMFLIDSLVEQEQEAHDDIILGISENEEAIDSIIGDIE